jgi:Ser/Thr protein kinase RdoA (MazF antagonist)
MLALGQRLTKLADELAASSMPSSVEHNDPHPGNVFATSGRLFDFGDAVVGHGRLSRRTRSRFLPTSVV